MEVDKDQQSRCKTITFYRLRKTICTISDDETQDVWLGTTSNKASSCQPRIISGKILWNLICVLDGDDLERLPAGVNGARGKVIDKNNEHLKRFFLNDVGTPIDEEDKYAVRISASVPLPYGFFFKTGTLNQSALQSLEEVEGQAENVSSCLGRGNQLT